MTNDKIQMTNEIQISNDKTARFGFDLEERTLRFAISCIDLCKQIPKDIISANFIGQLIRSTSSVGANYREANESITKKDFNHRISICRREAKESAYWSELLCHSNPSHAQELRLLRAEAIQLCRIFAAINRSQHK